MNGKRMLEQISREYLERMLKPEIVDQLFWVGSQPIYQDGLWQGRQYCYSTKGDDLELTVYINVKEYNNGKVIMTYELDYEPMA